ncbi:DNA-binding GntR family transcriptional regulator [Bacillus ectoiniformans]|uniref:GntR family transcriptional regulator n=1 Tax=Bacillus ectoiniformans TaxID=1494429 RepID=UPI003083F568|nr:DNA-binding GntR family transcriptional regulator [Bacillus ectoiniformans]
MTNVFHHSLPQQIADKITKQIMTGDLMPGEKIIESNYASEYGTSRAPIREALYLLATEGLVERIPRKGTIVKGFSQSEINDLLDIRMTLEKMAMKRIQSASDHQSCLIKMEDLVEQMGATLHDEKQYALLNQEFHMTIIRMSQSNVIHELYQKLSKQLLSLQLLSFLEGEHIQKSYEEHQTIIHLLKNKQFDEASSLLEDHNQAVITRLNLQFKSPTK